MRFAFSSCIFAHFLPHFSKNAHSFAFFAHPCFFLDPFFASWCFFFVIYTFFLHYLTILNFLQFFEIFDFCFEIENH